MKDFVVIYFAAIDWRFRRQHHQFISLEIAKRGGRVIFVENTGVRWPSLRDLPRVRARLVGILRTLRRSGELVDERITVVPPRVLPIHPSPVVRALNRALLLRQVRGAAQQLIPERTIAWIGLPNWTSLDVARAFRPRLTVYYNADAFASVPGAHPTIRESERAVIRAADLVFVTSQRLRALCEGEGAAPIVVPVGVDLDKFRAAAQGRLPRPSRLEGLRGRLIGYMGGLNHKVDRRIIEALSGAFPGDSLVILGSVEDPAAVPRAAPNVHVLGNQPHEEVPAYLQHFDVCLIPYMQSEFTGSVYPAKLNEYLAAGRPVVSTPLPEVLPFAGVVRLALDSDEFVANVREALEEPTSPELVAARVAVAAQSSYTNVVGTMLAKIEERLWSEGAGVSPRVAAQAPPRTT